MGKINKQTLSTFVLQNSYISIYFHLNYIFIYYNIINIFFPLYTNNMTVRVLTYNEDNLYSSLRSLQQE